MGGGGGLSGRLHRHWAYFFFGDTCRPGCRTIYYILIHVRSRPTSATFHVFISVLLVFILKVFTFSGVSFLLFFIKNMQLFYLWFRRGKHIFYIICRLYIKNIFYTLT